MKTDEDIDGLMLRIAASTRAVLRKEFEPLHEKIETYTEGLHQAKFENQCLRADLGKEQKKYDTLRTLVENYSHRIDYVSLQLAEGHPQKTMLTGIATELRAALAAP